MLRLTDCFVIIGPDGIKQQTQLITLVRVLARFPNIQGHDAVPCQRETAAKTGKAMWHVLAGLSLPDI